MESLIQLLIVLAGAILSLFLAYRRNDDAEAKSLVELLKKRLDVYGDELEKVKADLTTAMHELAECRQARANLAGENIDLMRKLLVRSDHE